MTQSQNPVKNSDPIVFYSKAGCPWCNAVRHLLNEHQVSYQERDILEDEHRKHELQRATGKNDTPTLQIGDQWFVDTDAKAVARQLGLPEPATDQMSG